MPLWQRVTITEMIIIDVGFTTGDILIKDFFLGLGDFIYYLIFQLVTQGAMYCLLIHLGGGQLYKGPLL